MDNAEPPAGEIMPCVESLRRGPISLSDASLSGEDAASHSSSTKPYVAIKDEGSLRSPKWTRVATQIRSLAQFPGGAATVASYYGKARSISPSPRGLAEIQGDVKAPSPPSPRSEGPRSPSPILRTFRKLLLSPARRRPTPEGLAPEIPQCASAGSQEPQKGLETFPQASGSGVPECISGPLPGSTGLKQNKGSFQSSSSEHPGATASSGTILRRVGSLISRSRDRLPVEDPEADAGKTEKIQELLLEMQDLRQRCKTAETAWVAAESARDEAESAKMDAESALQALKEHMEAQAAVGSGRLLVTEQQWLKEEREKRAEAEKALSEARSELAGLKATISVEVQRCTNESLEARIRELEAALNLSTASLHGWKEDRGKLLEQLEEQRKISGDLSGRLKELTDAESVARARAEWVQETLGEGTLEEVKAKLKAMEVRVCELERERGELQRELKESKKREMEEKGGRWMSEEELEEMQTTWREKGRTEAQEFLEFVEQQMDVNREADDDGRNAEGLNDHGTKWWTSASLEASKGSQVDNGMRVVQRAQSWLAWG